MRSRPRESLMTCLQIREKNDKFQQRKLYSMFAAKAPQDTSGDMDMEVRPVQLSKLQLLICRDSTDSTVAVCTTDDS